MVVSPGTVRKTDVVERNGRVGKLAKPSRLERDVCRFDSCRGYLWHFDLALTATSKTANMSSPLRTFSPEAGAAAAVAEIVLTELRLPCLLFDPKLALPSPWLCLFFWHRTRKAFRFGRKNFGHIALPVCGSRDRVGRFSSEIGAEQKGQGGVGMEALASSRLPHSWRV